MCSVKCWIWFSQNSIQHVKLDYGSMLISEIQSTGEIQFHWYSIKMFDGDSIELSLYHACLWLISLLQSRLICTSHVPLCSPTKTQCCQQLYDHVCPLRIFLCYHTLCLKYQICRFQISFLVSSYSICVLRIQM